jgi:hypothetical protein
VSVRWLPVDTLAASQGTLLAQQPLAAFLLSSWQEASMPESGPENRLEILDDPPAVGVTDPPRPTNDGKRAVLVVRKGPGSQIRRYVPQPGLKPEVPAPPPPSITPQD